MGPCRRPKMMLTCRFVVSPKLKELLQKMLTHNPIQRITLEEVCEHAWLAEVGRPQSLQSPQSHHVRSCIMAVKDARRLVSEHVCFLSHCLPCQRLT